MGCVNKGSELPNHDAHGPLAWFITAPSPACMWFYIENVYIYIGFESTVMHLCKDTFLSGFWY